MLRTAIEIVLIPVWTISVAIMGERILLLVRRFDMSAGEVLGGQFVLTFLLEIAGMLILLFPFVSISRPGPEESSKPVKPLVVWLPFILFATFAFAAIVFLPLTEVSREYIFWYVLGAEVTGMIFSPVILYALSGN